MWDPHNTKEAWEGEGEGVPNPEWAWDPTFQNPKRRVIPRLSRAELEELLGRPIPDEVWAFEPWGRRITVLRDMAPKKSPGGIDIPDTAQEELAAGTVLRVGWACGQPSPASYGECPFVNPGAMVGAHVVFGRWCGYALTDNAQGQSDPYSSDWLVMPVDDVWGHTPLTASLGAVSSRTQQRAQDALRPTLHRATVLP